MGLKADSDGCRRTAVISGRTNEQAIKRILAVQPLLLKKFLNDRSLKNLKPALGIIVVYAQM